MKHWPVLISFQFLFVAAHAASPSDMDAPRRYTIAVLDPVDLATQKSDSAQGDFLRRSLNSRSGWNALDPDSMRAKGKEFGFSAYRNCHEFQCAFDAGNIFAAEFVLFTSVSRLGGIYAYTLNLVHVRGSRTIWSSVGQAGPGRSGDPRISLEEAWTRLLARIAPEKILPAERGRIGQITVLDLSARNWAPAQAVAERVTTHLYASNAFDIMGSREQDELVAALGIDKAAFIPTDSAVFDLGRSMGVTHLVSSRLIEDRQHALRLELGYYDIKGRRKIKGDRSANSEEMVDALRFETGFFSSLFPLARDSEVGLREPGRSSSNWIARVAGVAGLTAGIAGGYLAYRFDQTSRAKYGQIEASRSRESALALRGNAEISERRSRVWGAVGCAGVLAGGALLVFAF